MRSMYAFALHIFFFIFFLRLVEIETFCCVSSVATAYAKNGNFANEDT